MIDINRVTLKNNVMFNIVMHRKNLCKMCLERILNKRITDISYPESEKTIDIDLDAKSIRLDIYCEDEDTSYDVELQNGIYPALPERSRYYQDLIDIDLLDKGCEYDELKNSIVIFICTFDLFGKGRHLYTFENICLQDKELYLRDRTSKIFLNTKGQMDDVPKPLKSFLDYIDNGIVTDDFTRELDDTVDEVRKSKEWRKKIMTVEQLIKDEAYLARKAGVEEGIEKGQDALNYLNECLLNDGRMDDLQKAIKDEELRKKLVKEYNIDI